MPDINLRFTGDPLTQEPLRLETSEWGIVTTPGIYHGVPYWALYYASIAHQRLLNEGKEGLVPGADMVITDLLESEREDFKIHASVKAIHVGRHEDGRYWMKELTECP